MAEEEQQQREDAPLLDEGCVEGTPTRVCPPARRGLGLILNMLLLPHSWKSIINRLVFVRSYELFLHVVQRTGRRTERVVVADDHPLAAIPDEPPPAYTSTRWTNSRPFGSRALDPKSSEVEPCSFTFRWPHKSPSYFLLVI